MKKDYLKKRWRKLDNTAKIFSLDDKKNTNVFRYSVILKQKINKCVLKKALEKALKRYPSFKVKIGSGIFWNYFEYNPKQVLVKEESEIPCNHINYKTNNDYLFKVTYYNKKINLDIFHALTDGTGAIKFLKAILYNYLDIKNHSFDEEEKLPPSSHKDLYLKHYDKKIKEHTNFKGVYLFSGKVNHNINNTYHYITNVNEVKKVSKKYNSTITEYLTALYIYALYLSIYNKKVGKELVITIPVNLRKYYKEDTLSNFFVCMDVNPKILEKKLNSFDEILNEVKNEFNEKLNKSMIKKYLSRDVQLGMNIPIRLVPLSLKKIFIKYMGVLFTKSATSTLSNVGIIEVDDKYKKYIDNILVMVMPGRIQKIKCTICSFNRNLNITMNSNINDLEFENTFYNLLKKEVKKLKLESNNLRG